MSGEWKYCLPEVTERAFIPLLNPIDAKDGDLRQTLIPTAIKELEPKQIGWALHKSILGEFSWHYSRLFLTDTARGNEILSARKACKDYKAGNSTFHGLFPRWEEDGHEVCEKCLHRAPLSL